MRSLVYIVGTALAALAACTARIGDGPAVDGGPGDDAGVDGSPALAAELYPSGRTLSPITPHVADRLRAIAANASRQEAVFAKVGASATVSLNFMHCFAGNFVELGVDLDGRDSLSATLAFFLAGDAAGRSSFERDSLTATVGWSAGAALAGSPSPLQQEVDAIDPRFAVIMYGTNDIQQNDLDGYGDNLLTMADTLIAAGVVPIFTNIMPRDDSASADAQVPFYNLISRGVAQSRQVPYIDYHRELVPLADHGLGADDLHPSVHREQGVARPCYLTAEGLTAGYNIRNLLTLQTLDRLRALLVDGDAAPDTAVRSQTGDGSHAAPFAIETLPFTHVADTRASVNRAIDFYDGCSATQDESGAEYVYRLELTASTRIRAFVSDRGAAADVDLHLLSGGTDGGSCVMRDHRELVAELSAGTHYLIVDSFVSSGTAQEGEYVLFVMEEP